MNYDLVLGIDEGLAVVTLDQAMGRPHLSRVVIRDVAADLFFGGPILGLIFLEPPLETLRLFL